MVHSLALHYGALLDRIRRADGFPLPLPLPLDKQPNTGEKLVPFYLHPADHAAVGVKPTGRAPLSILQDMLAYEAEQGEQFWSVLPEGEAALDQIECVAFHPEVLKQGNAGLHAVIAGLLEYWRALDKHKSPLRKSIKSAQAMVADLQDGDLSLNRPTCLATLPPRLGHFSVITRPMSPFPWSETRSSCSAAQRLTRP